MNFGARLLQALNEKGISQAELGRRIGATSQSVNGWCQAGILPRKEVLEQLSEATGKPLYWFFMDDDEPDVAHIEKHDPRSTIPPESEWGTVDAWDSKTPLPADEVEVPFLKDIEFAAGSGRITNEDHNGFKLRFSKATLRRVGANTDGSGVLCFPARGDSMEPNIPDGTTVAVNTNDKRIIDGKIYAISQNGWNRVKLLYRIGPDTVSIRSYNSAEHPPEDRPISEVEIIGRVFWWSVIDY